jgi:Rps23 Pro-64 3,4-dihydroxylase Tpa1-like proline 4-hydroxylase
MHYLWHPLSGINFHSDADCEFGATIYLNREWNINHGGWLLAHNRVQEDFTAYPPIYNSCIINADKQGHAVSMTSALAPIRHTIQIFGRK